MKCEMEVGPCDAFVLGEMIQFDEHIFQGG